MSAGRRRCRGLLVSLVAWVLLGVQLAAPGWAQESPENPVATEGLSWGVEAISESEFVVDPERLLELLRDQGLREAAIPGFAEATQGSTPSGVRLLGIEAGDLCDALGLWSGDVITAIDGEPVTFIGDIWPFFAALITPGEHTVDLDRGGVLATYLYEVGPLPPDLTLEATNVRTLFRLVEQTGRSTYRVHVTDVAGLWSRLLAADRSIEVVVEPLEDYDEQDAGLRITAVSRGSWSQMLGFREGDVLVAVNGQPLADLADLTVLYDALGSAESVTVLLYWNGHLLARQIEFVD